MATLAIFSSTGADPKLNALIFGESVLNDAVAIVLFKTLVEMGVSTNLGIGGWEAMTAASVFSVVGKFLLIFCGSLLVGVCSGWRRRSRSSWCGCATSTPTRRRPPSSSV